MGAATRRRGCQRGKTLVIGDGFLAFYFSCIIYNASYMMDCTTRREYWPSEAVS